MIRSKFIAKLAGLALLAGVATVNLPSAYALPHFGLHQHPADLNDNRDNRVTLEVYNHGASFRDVLIDGHIYTLPPKHTLNIKAPEGTRVFTNTTGMSHHKGDLLFSIDRSMQHKVLPID